MKIKKIYINFEGVLADFEGRVKELWGIASPDDDCTLDECYRFWERIRNEKHFYESLTPLPGSLEMVKNLYETYGNICEIVSEIHYIFDPNLKKCFWVEDEDVCAAKTEWVQKFLAIDIKSEWLFGGAVNCKNAGYILIDCCDEKIKEWKMHGGTGILYSNPQETLRELRNIEEAFSRQGYKWVGASLHIREHEGQLQSVAIQKIYLSALEPIWKRCSARPVEEYRWVGFNEELPENLEIPEGEFYFDATTNPPRGRHYREQGILVYDDTDEVVILGIKDSNAEIVEIPREINGKPVTILDERCFANCSENLRKVILPDTLREIGDCAFKHCKKLEKPEIPASVTKIGKDLFGSVFV